MRKRCYDLCCWEPRVSAGWKGQNPRKRDGLLVGNTSVSACSSSEKNLQSVEMVFCTGKTKGSGAGKLCGKPMSSGEN